MCFNPCLQFLGHPIQPTDRFLDCPLPQPESRCIPGSWGNEESRVLTLSMFKSLCFLRALYEPGSKISESEAVHYKSTQAILMPTSGSGERKGREKLAQKHGHLDGQKEKRSQKKQKCKHSWLGRSHSSIYVVQTLSWATRPITTKEKLSSRNTQG